MDHRAAAWEAVHAAKPPGWYVGHPGQRYGGQWAVYAYDTTEKAQVGRRTREWTAVGATEAECLLEMARCLREIGLGRVPRWELTRIRGRQLPRECTGRGPVAAAIALRDVGCAKRGMPL